MVLSSIAGALKWSAVVAVAVSYRYWSAVQSERGGWLAGGGHKLKYQSVLLSNKRPDDWLQPGDVLKVIYHKYLSTVPNSSEPVVVVYLHK